MRGNKYIMSAGAETLAVACFEHLVGASSKHRREANKRPRDIGNKLAYTLIFIANAINLRQLKT